MHVDLTSLSRMQALKVVMLGFALSFIPFFLGELFGLGTFVVTPVIGVVMAVIFGILVTRIAPQAPWPAGVLLSLTVALVYVGIFCAIIFSLALINHQGITSGLEQMAAVFPAIFIPVAGAAVCVALGVRLGQRQ